MDPLFQAGQAAALGRVSPADAVVGDLHDEMVVSSGDGNRHGGRLGMLGHVGQRLGDHEVGGAFHGRQRRNRVP